ncbi:hypothetical protein KBD33_00105 [Candidatus Gracilibacteria bacterium]|nr:hypothetical protein [Candidatus Gracilibacteria bacterium]
MNRFLIYSISGGILVFFCNIQGIFALDVLPGVTSVQELATQVANNTTEQVNFFTAESNVSDNPVYTAANRTVNSSEASESGDSSITVFVTEMIPGAKCECVSMTPGNNPSARIIDCGDITTRKYQCTLEPGLSSFQKMFAGIIRYLIYIVLLLGVLALASLGVAWGWAGGDDVKMKTNLKKWGINIFAGLIILFLFQYILRFIAPWVYQ